jgi:hypothetical protein
VPEEVHLICHGCEGELTSSRAAMADQMAKRGITTPVIAEPAWWPSLTSSR